VLLGGSVILIILGTWWCREVIERLPRDIAELRAGDWADRSAIVVVWALTVAIASAMVGVLVEIVTNIGWCS